MIHIALSGLLAFGGCYQPPVTTPVTHPFEAPACTWCAGNRGLEYAPGRGTPVAAAAAGTVVFSGSVAGVQYVVVQQVDGRKATYGRLLERAVATGERVEAGDVVAASGDELFFGLREGSRYVDPAPFLGGARFAPRLLPDDGRPGRPARPLAPRCRVEA